MPLVRGAVYVLPVEVMLPEGVAAVKEKYVVVLQDASRMDANATRIAYVLCSSDNTGSDGPRSHEVQLGRSDGFPHSTVVDGRWVFTSARKLFDETRFTGHILSEDRMGDISVAVLIGLQLAP